MVKKVCRLCAKEKKRGIDIYQEEGLELNLSSKIIRCLQIRVYPEDPLPKMVCITCCSKLNQTSQFFETSLKAQTVLQMRARIQKGTSADDFSQSQGPQDTRDFAECSLLGNPNQHEFIAPYPCFEKQEEREEALKPERGKRSHNVVKHRLCDKVIKETKGHGMQIPDSAGTKEGPDGDIRQKETLRHRLRLEDCYTWQCTDCPTVLATLQELKEHHRLAHDQTVRFQCIECAKVYVVYKKFTRHVRVHRNSGKHRCKDCGKSFSSKQTLENHMVLHSDIRPHTCLECGKTFRQIGSLYSHRQVHQADQNGFPCSECGKLLLSRQSLEVHRKSHSGIRDYTCDVCGKSFAVKQGLTYHMMSHSGERPHCCQFCGKRCKTVYLLNKHVATHSNVKVHQCDVCGKQFRESSTLKLHTRIHTGAMPYQCEFCGRHFRFQGVYVIHRRQHTGERPYSCSDCKRDFTNWANYNKHIKCRHQGNSRATLAADKAQLPATYYHSSSNKKQNIRNSKEADTSATSISCSLSFPTDYSKKNAIRPYFLDQNRAECEVTFDESASATRIDKMIHSLCPLEESPKPGVSAAVVGNQYTSSHSYSHVSTVTPCLSGCLFSSNTNNEYTNESGLSG